MVWIGKIGIGKIIREIMVGDFIILIIEVWIMLEIYIGRIIIFWRN